MTNEVRDFLLTVELCAKDAFDEDASETAEELALRIVELADEFKQSRQERLIYEDW